MLKIKYPNTQIFFDDSFENLSSYIQISDKENVFYFIDKKVLKFIMMFLIHSKISL